MRVDAGEKKGICDTWKRHLGREENKERQKGSEKERERESVLRDVKEVIKGSNREREREGERYKGKRA